MNARHQHIRNAVLPLLRPYVRMIALYGSWARDEERPDSDIDLLVVLRPAEDRPPLGLKWFALEQELSERLQRPVELVTDAALDPYLRPSIERDAVVLYDEE